MCPEFDKRTSLGVKGTFPKMMYSANFISETISKDICAQLAREVVSLVPQVVDYSCTICEYPIPKKNTQSLGCMAGRTVCHDWKPNAHHRFLGFSLCWLPIRLDCTHLFCIRCMIKMQNQNKRYCPLCRADVVQSANECMASFPELPLASANLRRSPHRR